MVVFKVFKVKLKENGHFQGFQGHYVCFQGFQGPLDTLQNVQFRPILGSSERGIFENGAMVFSGFLWVLRISLKPKKNYFLPPPYQ